MHIELRHLRTVRAIHEAGGLARAATRLNLTQSALSHQVKALEDQLGQPLFVRKTKPLRLSDAGLRFLKAAERILPEIDALRAEFERLGRGATGRLHIAIECHACYEWLFPVLEQFRRAWPDVDIDIRPGLSFQALPALMREEVDLVVSSDPDEGPEATFVPLFDYSPVVVAPMDDPLAGAEHVVAEDFRGRTLLTYPVDRTRLDVFTECLTPAGVEPGEVRQVELTAMILMLVGSGRGIAVLPDWVLRGMGREDEFTVRPLNDPPAVKRLHAAVRPGDETVPYMAQFVRLARQQAVRLQRG